MITIGLDVRSLLEDYESGVKVYTREFLKALSQLPCHIRPFYTKRQKKENFLAEAEWIPRFNALDIVSYPYRQAFWNKKVDILWYPDRRPTLWHEAPQVMSLHDFSPEKYSSSLSLKSKIFHRAVSLEKLKSQVNHFIVPSQSIQKEALSYGIKAHCILEACPSFSPQQKAREKDSFFSILSPDARKGWDDLEALARYFPEKVFYIFGGPVKDARFKKNKTTWPANIKIEKEPSQDKKEEYFAKAEAFLSLTHYEGFNLPLLEAQAAGCPVLARKIPLHEELYSSQGFFTSLEDLKFKMEHRLYTKLELRQELSWQKSAEELLLFFERIVHDKNR